jgi:hypothetical protein
MGPEAVVPVEDDADSFREHVPVADRAAVDEEPACGPLVRQPVAVLEGQDVAAQLGCVPRAPARLDACQVLPEDRQVLGEAGALQCMRAAF